MNVTSTNSWVPGAKVVAVGNARAIPISPEPARLVFKNNAAPGAPLPKKTLLKLSKDGSKSKLNPSAFSLPLATRSIGTVVVLEVEHSVAARCGPYTVGYHDRIGPRLTSLYVLQNKRSVGRVRDDCPVQA